MNIPAPYFKDVPIYGNLYMERVLVMYDYPLLSVLKNDSDGKFLCMCFDTRNAQQWLITPVQESDTAALLENRLEIRTLFVTGKEPKIMASLDYGTRTETFTLINAGDIPEYALPESGVYME